LDVRDNEDAEMASIRIQRAKMNLYNEQVLFQGQVQELKDAQNDARLEKQMKLKHSLQESSLDTAHHRSMAFVTERSSALMAMTGLQPLRPQSFASFRREQLTQSTNIQEKIVGNRDANKNDDRSNNAQAMMDDKGDDEADADDEEEKQPWMV
jgi:hypothetical protein